MLSLAAIIAIPVCASLLVIFLIVIIVRYRHKFKACFNKKVEKYKSRNSIRPTIETDVSYIDQNKGEAPAEPPEEPPADVTEVPSGPENFLVFRIIIVGAKGVGKTSIVR
jgi:hypothetical protein